ncbi:hypothetical protein niasHT_006019 [Heterodera trifolii]|uniref:Uncharacterized protein n=1 Tax=Heterodera trifolii TaxID=157864 RepID=A0ABD2M763_9BILA
MANLVKLVGFFILVLLWPKALANITSEVKDMMDKFSSLKAYTNDIVKKLRNVSDNIDDFIWVTRPVSAIIKAGAKTAFQPNAEELEAIKIWHNFVKVEFENLIEAVRRPMNGLEELYKNITDPDKDRSQYLEKFRAGCLAQLEVLQHFWPNLWVDDAHLQNELNKIIQTASKLDVGQALIKLHLDLHRVQNGCFWLEKIADGNEWKREPLLRFADIMRLDLMKASLLSAHCVEIMYDDPQTQLILFVWVKETIKATALNMVEWIENKLKITWPTISISRAETAIGNWPIVENESEYNIVAHRIKKELDQIGEKIFFHTVIVFPNWTDERQKAVTCDDYYCFKLIKNHINVIVIRCEHDHYEEAVAAEDWFNQTVEEQMESTIKEWLRTKKDEPLITLAIQIHPLLYYRSMVLLRNRGIPQIGTTITLGVTPTEISSARAERSFNKMIITEDGIEEIFHVHLLV